MDGIGSRFLQTIMLLLDVVSIIGIAVLFAAPPHTVHFVVVVSVVVIAPVVSLVVVVFVVDIFVSIADIVVVIARM